jgi:hypothetical protein
MPQADLSWARADLKWKSEPRLPRLARHSRGLGMCAGEPESGLGTRADWTYARNGTGVELLERI